MKLHFLVFLMVHNSSEADSNAAHDKKFSVDYRWRVVRNDWEKKSWHFDLSTESGKSIINDFVSLKKTTQSFQFWLSCSNDDSDNKDNIFDHLRNWFGNQKVSDLWYIFPSMSLTTTSSIIHQRLIKFSRLRCSRNFLSFFPLSSLIRIMYPCWKWWKRAIRKI